MSMTGIRRQPMETAQPLCRGPGDQVTRNGGYWSRNKLVAGVQSLCVFMAGVRHKSSTLFQSEIARDRGPEALVSIPMRESIDPLSIN